MLRSLRVEVRLSAEKAGCICGIEEGQLDRGGVHCAARYVRSYYCSVMLQAWYRLYNLDIHRV